MSRMELTPKKSSQSRLLKEVEGVIEESSISIESQKIISEKRVIENLRYVGFEDAHLDKGLTSSFEIDFRPDLSDLKGSKEFVQKIPIWFARKYCLMGFDVADEVIAVALNRIEKLPKFDVVSRFLGKSLRLFFSTVSQIEKAINLAYQQQEGQAKSYVEKISEDDVMSSLDEMKNDDDLLETTDRAPVIKLVNLILFEAVKQAASDVHIHPDEAHIIVRMRIDGILFDIFTLPMKWHKEVVSRIKVMGMMDIAEKRLAQDGRTSVKVGDRQIDLRISSIPTSLGERIVFRLLDKSARMYKLEELGMNAHQLAIFHKLIHIEHGLILVTGPTGSGKSTTLYAALQEINSKEKNILTLEDPIEYKLEGISQTQVNEKKGMTFAKGLRNVLRQDPDIIMVGEIRDHETAMMAIQSALTGHLVFSTLHTNDAPSAVTRLLDLGIEPYLVASSVMGVVAQRLVRKICSNCKSPYLPDAEEIKRIQHIECDSRNQLYMGKGCSFCRETGFKGRIGLFELLLINDEIRKKITDRDAASSIREIAVRSGMETLKDDGVLKYMKGITGLTEVLRVTVPSLEKDYSSESSLDDALDSTDGFAAL